MHVYISSMPCVVYLALKVGPVLTCFFVVAATSVDRPPKLEAGCICGGLDQHC